MKIAFALIILALVALAVFKPGANQLAMQQQKQKLDEKLQPPEGWDAWQAALEQHKLPSIKINLLNQKPAKVDQSKFGGEPWWPSDKQYPEGINGKPLIFLAQINFAEIPGGIEHYPKQGMLQFFIADDDLYGLEFLDKNNNLENYLQKRKNFAVIYHPEIALNKHKARRNGKVSDMSPIVGASAIGFQKVNDIASPMDYRFAKITAHLGEGSDDIMDHAYDQLAIAPDHKLGGYASFTQEDPRAYYGTNQNWLLLFQMDTDSNDHIDIMWGDAGIGNFFIKPDDLKNLDFSKVWYNWDCH